MREFRSKLFVIGASYLSSLCLSFLIFKRGHYFTGICLLLNDLLHTKQLMQYLVHSKLSINVDSCHVFPREVKGTVNPSLFAWFTQLGFRVFLVGEMRNGSNSKIELLKKTDLY